ncbi:MAG TPA: AAA family ATPase, partial [Myxococcota bacterium]|nr:AAA family ATPase [Myxococcota bacterium]
MDLNRLRIENYRAFASPQEVAIAPLTLVYGYNHAGKSALLRALPLLADSSTDISPTPLNLESRAVRSASFSDIRCRRFPDTPIGFGLQGTLGQGLDFSWDAKVDAWGAPLSRQQLVAWHTQWGGASDLRELRAEAISDVMSPAALAGHYRVRGSDLPDGMATLSLDGLAPSLREGPPAAEVGMELTRRILRELRNSIQWLEAVRRRPERRERLMGAAPRQMQPDGQGAAQLLAADQGRELLASIQAFFRGGGSRSDNYHLDLSVEAEDIRLRLSPADAPAMYADLADAGEGMAQVFPVLVALARAERGAPGDPRLVIAEQPELHLHPRMELRLGERLCALASLKSPPRVIVETHSEALLLSIQLALLEERLDPSRVAIHWVRQLAEGESVVERVQIA